jgi:hypothetical protein
MSRVGARCKEHRAVYHLSDSQPVESRESWIPTRTQPTAHARPAGETTGQESCILWQRTCHGNPIQSPCRRLCCNRDPGPEEIGLSSSVLSLSVSRSAHSSMPGLVPARPGKELTVNQRTMGVRSWCRSTMMVAASASTPGHKWS